MGDQLERLGSEAISTGLESSMKGELCMEIDPPFSENTATPEDWRKALNKVVPAVVVLRTTACRAFDTESAGASYATGFVVDKRRGIILTNRHVVKPGPVVSEATFLNREEIPVYPVYRDPVVESREGYDALIADMSVVHDFGFFRYDPQQIRFLSYDEIPLAPEAASVGLEIRVVGNDSGEKVSILAGTVARLDRDAPHYKKDGYNDFNTFYMQDVGLYKSYSYHLSDTLPWSSIACRFDTSRNTTLDTPGFRCRFAYYKDPSATSINEEKRKQRNRVAASGTKGGSSGSPVIDWQGRAVALNAGSKSSSASAFFLPLERVVRALRYLQNGRDLCADEWPAVTIPRGTLQVTFVHKGFDETFRLGLQRDTELMVRHASPPGETGMLVVDSVVPGGPAHKRLETGDVLVRVNGEVMTQFLKLETLLDDSVSQKVELEIERGGTSLTVDLMVQDLHSVTPDHFLEVSGGVIHPLSYQQARNFRFTCGIVYVADPGYMLSRAGVPRHAIIKKFAGQEVSCLEELISVFSKLSRSVLITVDRHEWYALPRIYTRNDSTGLWVVKPALPPESPLLSSGINHVNGGASNEAVLSDVRGVCSMDVTHQDNQQKLTDGVAIMETNSDHNSEDANSRDESDTGSKKRKVEECSSADGIASTDGSVYEPREENLEESGVLENAVRDCQGETAAVPNASVAERVIEPTLVMFEVVFLHPVHNYALVAYDPAALGAAGAAVVRAAELLPDPALRRGDAVYLVGLSRSLQATSRKSIVTNPCAALNIGSADSPRYRAINMEVIELDTDFGSTFSGVLTDDHGRVQAIWGSFSTQLRYGSSSSEDHQFVRGIPIYAISQVLDKILSGSNGVPLLINGIKRPMPLVRILEVELYPTLLSKARSFGLSNDWIQHLLDIDIVAVMAQIGDMVLAINKEPVTCFRDIENACQDLDKYGDSDGSLKMTIFRQGCEMEVVVGTDVRDGIGTVRAVNWCGCIVQDSHAAVRALGFLPEEGHGVYVARWCHGSPVHRYGLYALQWIVEVNGKPTPDLDSFVSSTKELEHGDYARVRTVHLNGKPRVLTLKQDLHYWPTWELRFDSNTSLWRRNTIKALDTAVA
ncbi:Protease Do-like 7 [Bienertia sinuspersici]